MREEGPKTIIIRGQRVPESFVNDAGIRYHFEQMAVLDRDGGFELSQLAEGQCIIYPGVIYSRSAG